MSYNHLDENARMIKQPKGLTIKLRRHQLVAIAAMVELEKKSSVVIENPDLESGLYETVRTSIQDVNEFTNSTFVMETNSAILADKVGAGKSLDIVGLILHNQQPQSHDRFIVGTNHFTVKMLDNKDSCSTNLVVVPHNLVNQWIDFIDKSRLMALKLSSITDFDMFFDIDFVKTREVVEDCPMVTYTKILRKVFEARKAQMEDPPDLKLKKNDLVYERRCLNLEKVQGILSEAQIILLNINRYRYFKQIFPNTRWARVIIDEMDSAAIPNVFNEYGNFNWFLTATPTSIFHKSCRRYVNKIFGTHQHLLNYFVVKNKDEFVDRCIELPKPRVFIIDTMLQAVVSAIQDMIPPDVMQLINSGNMREAINKLNCDVDTEENIVKVFKNKHETEMHNLLAELDYLKNIVPHDVEAHERRLLKIEEDIKRCEDRINMIDERINAIKDDCCIICADAYSQPTIMDCCKSVFCFKCLILALSKNKNCPYCRHEMKGKEYHVIGSKSDSKKKSKTESRVRKGFGQMDKSDTLEKLLCYLARHVANPKILIFSDYPQTFNKIVTNIARANLQYSLISGTPGHIANIIEQFYTGSINILLLDSNHYGSGLNLQNADYLIIYHRMLPELEEQVVGRAQRDGRKVPLRIIFLLNESENHVTPITPNPIMIQDESDLNDIVNIEDDDNEFMENADESDDELKSKKKIVVTEKKSKTRDRNKDSKKSKKKSRKSKSESESEPEFIMSADDDDILLELEPSGSESEPESPKARKKNRKRSHRKDKSPKSRPKSKSKSKKARDPAHLR